MNPKIKTKWLKALRSGKYQQAEGTLKVVDANGKSYCCLGVLCDLYCKTKKIEWNYDWTDLLPTEVSEWAGIDTESPEVKYGKDKQLKELAWLNDTKKLNFEQIAKVIEREL